MFFVLLIFLKFPLYVFQLRQSDLVLVFPTIFHSNLLQDGQRFLRSEVDDKIKWSFFDVEDQYQENDNKDRQKNDNIRLPTLQQIEEQPI